MAIEEFKFGRLYAPAVRRIHHRKGVTLREVKNLFTSEFYVDTSTEAGQKVARIVGNFAEQLRLERENRRRVLTGQEELPYPHGTQ